MKKIIVIGLFSMVAFIGLCDFSDSGRCMATNPENNYSIETTHANLEWNMRMAELGDSYGCYKMAERCMTGDGVEQNHKKAVEYLKAAAAGENTQVVKIELEETSRILGIQTRSQKERNEQLQLQIEENETKLKLEKIEVARIDAQNILDKEKSRLDEERARQAQIKRQESDEVARIELAKIQADKEIELAKIESVKATTGKIIDNQVKSNDNEVKLKEIASKVETLKVQQPFNLEMSKNWQQTIIVSLCVVAISILLVVIVAAIVYCEWSIIVGLIIAILAFLGLGLLSKKKP